MGFPMEVHQTRDSGSYVASAGLPQDRGDLRGVFWVGGIVASEIEAPNLFTNRV
jgi:hypothetical protein